MDKQVIFQFLNDLRESGSINMFSAPPYVQEAFGLTRRQAIDVVVDWMESFKSDNLLH